MAAGAADMATSVGTWIRVSSGGQDEANQVPDVERHCQQRGYRINKRYELHDKSASKGEQEAALKEALDDVRAGVIKKLIPWHSDRLDRRGVIKALSFIEDFRAAGGEIESVKEGILDEDSLDTIVAAWMNREKSKHLGEQVGIAHDRIRANRPNGKGLLGRAPFGLDIKGDKYEKVLHPSDLGLRYVPQIFDRIIDGDSLATVAKWLNSENVPTGCEWRRKPKNGKPGEPTKGWTASTVCQIIRNTVYKGQMRDSNHEFVSTCEPIVSGAVWRQAQERLDKFPKRGPENNANKKLCTSHLFCALCDSPMYPAKTAAIEPYYRCSGKLAKDKKPCGVMVHVSVVDDIVNESFSADLRPSMKLTLNPGKNYDDDLDRIDAQSKALSRKDPDYKARRAALDAEYDRLMELDTTPDEWKQMATTKDGKAIPYELALLMDPDDVFTEADRWNAADFAGKRDMLKEWRITFKWAMADDGQREPVVTIGPLWADTGKDEQS